MKQRQVWDAIAEGWTHWRNKPMEEVVAFANKINKKHRGKLRVLDVGCGNCRNLIPFSDHKLYGVDFSKNMVKEGKKICKKENIDVDFKLSEIRKLSFKNNYFDVVLCTSVIQCLEKDREKVVQEMFRVLKPGAYAIISTWYKPSRREAWVPWKRRRIEYLRYYYYFKIDEFRELLENTGFKVIMLNKSDKKSEKTGKWNKNLFAEVRKPL